MMMMKMMRMVDWNGVDVLGTVNEGVESAKKHNINNTHLKNHL
jgi:hypothetical protein